VSPRYFPEVQRKPHLMYGSHAGFDTAGRSRCCIRAILLWSTVSLPCNEDFIMYGAEFKIDFGSKYRAARTPLSLLWRPSIFALADTNKRALCWPLIAPRRRSRPPQVSWPTDSIMPSESISGTEPLAPHKASLEEFERSSDRRPAFILTWTEVKLLGIAGVRSVCILSYVTLMRFLGWIFPRWYVVA